MGSVVILQSLFGKSDDRFQTVFVWFQAAAYTSVGAGLNDHQSSTFEPEDEPYMPACAPFTVSSS